MRVNNETLRKERNYGIDLLRIVTMLMVVVLHVLSHGGILEKVKNLTWKGELIYLLRSLCFCAVNCYALISGYVGINSRHKYSGLISLWLQVLFYSILIAIIDSVFLYIEGGQISLKEIIKSCFPFTFSRYWYFTAYVCLFFFMPIFNHILTTVSRPALKKTALFVCFLFCVAALLYDENKEINRGFSFLWLAIMYLVGGYIAKYNPFKRLSVRRSVLLYIIFAALTYGSRIVIEIVVVRFLGIDFNVNILYAYNSITVVLQSIFLFNAFQQLKIKEGFGKGISFFAKAAFGVYLIHENPMIVERLIRNQFIGLTGFPAILTLISVLASAIAIYLMCTVIELFRIYLFKLLRIKKLITFFENAIKKIVSCFLKVLHIDINAESDDS